ncbi:hypothetical protein ACFSLT_07165 [Novosphingobium resinovorum]
MGIFTCDPDDLADLVDQVCEPGACEYKPMPPGGFVFGGEVVLHQLDEASEDTAVHFSDAYLTEEWVQHAYEDDGDWWPILIAEND